MAVNIEARIPKDKVIANPFIGPDPKTNKSKAAINVVILALILMVWHRCGVSIVTVGMVVLDLTLIKLSQPFTVEIFK